MKINEISSENVAVHPGVKAEHEFVELLHSGEDRMDDMVAFVMDDRMADARRLHILARIDELLGDRKDHYDASDLEDFMHDTGEISPEEADEIAQDMKLPPYHLQLVDEQQFDDELPTGEYEVCQTCGGHGEVHWDHTDEETGDHVPAKAACPDCEGGLNDVTGTFQIPDFD